MQHTHFNLTLGIIAVLLTLYITYKLKYKKRVLIDMNASQIFEQFGEDEGLVEKAEKEVDVVVSKYNQFNNIQSLKDKFTNMPLHEYCIKSSYNTARSGNYVSTKMIAAVLQRGCRFLDFEVFYIKEGNLYIPKVAVSSDVNYALLDTKNSISLDNALSTVATNAFSQNSPNSTDPIFVNLRIKSRDSNVYQAVAKSIDANLKTVAYSGKISKDTTLNELSQKVVIVVDKTVQPGYIEYAECKTGDTGCYGLVNYTSIESGSEYLNLYHYTDLLNHSNNIVLLKDDNIHTTATRMKMAIPDSILNTANPAFKEFVVKHGCQSVLYQFHIVDKNLLDYEEFFNDTMGGIVPLSVALPYFVKK
jgi:hypothetical protein